MPRWDNFIYLDSNNLKSNDVLIAKDNFYKENQYVLILSDPTPTTKEEGIGSYKYTAQIISDKANSFVIPANTTANKYKRWTE